MDLLKNPSLHATLVEGNPPPLSAMLAPGLGESLTRWEELGSGFSGHGFDDRDKERFLPDPNLPAIPADTPVQTYAEWFRERRANAVHTASERLSNIRARLFRWRLHMREIEKEEALNETPKLPIHSVSASTSPASSPEQSENIDPQAPLQTPEVRKSKSWVWQWSRHG